MALFILRSTKPKAIYNEKIVNFFISRCYFQSENSTLSAGKRKQLQGEIRTFIDSHSFVLYSTTAEACDQKFNEKEKAKNLGESFTSNSSIWQFPWNKHTFYENSENIFAKGYDALEDYVHGNNIFKDSRISPAFTALERFFDDKEKHEVSLNQLRSLKSGTSAAALLCTHLLSQLLFIPGNYFLDSVSTNKTLYDCPCGCGASIQYGSTKFGSPHLFYGSADVVLFPTNKDIFFNMETEPAVFNVEDPERPEIQMLDPDMWNSEDDVSEGEHDDICTMENNEKEFSEANINQICKQGISVSLWKYKNCFSQLNDSAPMVPVCLFNKNKFVVVMYNAEHDYLLRMRKTDFLSIIKHGKLQFTAIINLWLLIHHNLFCTQPHIEAIKNLKGTCGLIPRLGSENLITVMKTSKFNYDVHPVGKDIEPDMMVSQPATRWKRPSKYINKEHKKEGTETD